MNTQSLTLTLAIVAATSVGMALIRTLVDRQTRKSSLNLVRPDIRDITPLTPAEIAQVEDWSLRGVPTSASITLNLIATIDQMRIDAEIDRTFRRR